MINTFNFPKESEINALNRIKIKLGLNDGNKDELLTVLFDDASNLVCTYIIRKDFDENILSEYIVTLDKYIKENSNKLRLF